MVDLHKYLENDNNGNNKVLLAKVINLVDYKNSNIDKKLAEKSKNKYNGCFEINNFKKRKNNKVYGFINDTTGHSKRSNISIEKLGAAKTDNLIENCLIIFISDMSEIVGYYENATIFRNWKQNEYSKIYYFETSAQNATLLPNDNRISIELSKLKFGRSFKKYVDDSNKDYVSELLTKLENYNKNKSESIYQETNEISVSERKILVPHLKTEGRIPQNKVKEIKKIKGYTCEVCGFNFSNHYEHMKDSNFIELHHLNMYANLKDNEIRKLKETDFAVLCPNCHRMIHRLKNLNNDSRDIENLKKLYKK